MCSVFHGVGGTWGTGGMTSLIPSDGFMMSVRQGGNKQAMHVGGRSQQGPPNVNNIF